MLTVLTLSVFAIALIELSGVSSTALFHKYGIGNGGKDQEIHLKKEAALRMSKARSMPKTTMAFAEPNFKFDKIKEGKIVSHAFKFKNTGTAPLLIISAQASCGCTVPSYPKEPIPPGGSGEILVKFDSHNRTGHQEKNVLITSNAVPERVPVSFEVDVE